MRVARRVRSSAPPGVSPGKVIWIFASLILKYAVRYGLLQNWQYVLKIDKGLMLMSFTRPAGLAVELRSSRPGRRALPVRPQARPMRRHVLRSRAPPPRGRRPERVLAPHFLARHSRRLRALSAAWLLSSTADAPDDTIKIEFSTGFTILLFTRKLDFAIDFLWLSLTIYAYGMHLKNIIDRVTS